MNQRHSAEGQQPASATTHSGGKHIEQGWTVYDAELRAIGNVTGVDATRDVLTVDGRPAGFTAFEVPFTLVGRTGENEVHLTKSIDARSASTDSVPKFVDAPRPSQRQSPGVSTSKSGAATQVSPATGRGATTGNVRASLPHTGPVGVSEPTPIAGTSHTSSTGASQYGAAWHGNQAQPESSGPSGKRMAMTGAMLGGVALAGYMLKRRLRRKSRTEQFMDASEHFAKMAAEFAQDRHPAWWGGLAAAALPIAAYYAWPSQPTASERAYRKVGNFSTELEQQAGTLAELLPVASAMAAATVSQGFESLKRTAREFELTERWNSPSDMTVRSEVALSTALVAVSALAIYLARRATAGPRITQIGEVMTRRPRTINPNATIADAASMMRRLNVGALPVCDGSRLVGMISDRDITIRSSAEGRDPFLTTVREVMTSGVAWATEDDPVEEAARIMREHRIRRLPIVDRQHSLVGVVSLGDLAVDFADAEMSGDTLGEISEPSRPSR